MQLKVLVSVDLSRRLMMIVSMAWVIADHTSFTYPLYILILLLKLMYLFLQIISRK
jgi:hypothetical protein